MNKLTALALMTIIAGGSLFARGQDESFYSPRGVGQGAEREPIELITVEGTVTEDSYGNLMIEGKKENYLIRVLPTLNMSVEVGDVIEIEGFTQSTAYSKDDRDYQFFNITMITKDGITETIDLDSMGGPERMGMDSRSQGGRDSMDQRGGMGDRSFDGPRGEDSDSPIGQRGGLRGMTHDYEAGEEISISGEIILDEKGQPSLASNGKNYIVMMGRDHREGIEGSSVQLKGFEGPLLYTIDSEDYYVFIVTEAVVNGEVIEIEHPEDRESGGMGRRRPAQGE